jgi:iron(III) transport system substrate-binding protein
VGDLLAEKLKGKVVWAEPMFGTTATHCGALLAELGEDKFRALMTRWNQSFQTTAGNSEAARLVAEGAYPLGLTDTDDAWRLHLRGSPVQFVPFDGQGAGTLLIPTTAAMMAGAPHPEAAHRFMDAVLSPEVEKRIAFSPSRQLPVREEVEIPEDLKAWRNIPSLNRDYREVADHVDHAMEINRSLRLK